MSARTRAYAGNGEQNSTIQFVGEVAAAQTKIICPAYSHVQALTTQSAVEVMKTGQSPIQYGTAVHSLLNSKVKQLDSPTLKSEVSFLKWQEEALQYGHVPYGSWGSIRVDIFETTPNNEICVYDIKTGRSGLSPARFEQIARTIRTRNPKVKNFFVIEIRP